MHKCRTCISRGVRANTKLRGYDLALSLNPSLSHGPSESDRTGRMAHVYGRAHQGNDSQVHGYRTIDVWTDG